MGGRYWGGYNDAESLKMNQVCLAGGGGGTKVQKVGMPVAILKQHSAKQFNLTICVTHGKTVKQYGTLHVETLSHQLSNYKASTNKAWGIRSAMAQTDVQFVNQ